MERLTINCDLGEDEPYARTLSLLGLIDAANIGCGLHAGSLAHTRRTIRAALAAGVRIGAHPGLEEAGGRGLRLPTPDEFRRLLDDQVGSFQQILTEEGAALGYLKLHGSLYHAVERLPELADVYLDFLAAIKCPALSLAGGSFARRAQSVGVCTEAEAFLDRAYASDGSLVPRGQPGAVLDPEAARVRLLDWVVTGRLRTGEGTEFVLRADSWCVHGDSPGALDLLRALRKI